MQLMIHIHLLVYKVCIYHLTVFLFIIYLKTSIMEEQFFVLFQRYRRVVEKEAYKVSQEKGDVYDIVMDIMLYAHKKYTEGKYQMDGPFEVWLRHLATRYTISKYFRNITYTVPLYDVEDIVYDEDDFIEFEEKLLCMEELIDKLPSSKKELIKMYLNGKVIDEISIITNTRRSTVWDRLNKIRIYLKKGLLKAGFVNASKNNFY